MPEWYLHISFIYPNWSIVLVTAPRQVMSLDVNKVAQVPQKQNIKDLPTIKFFARGQDVGSYVATDRGEVFYRKMERELAAAMEKV